MTHTIELNGRPLEVHLSRRAAHALSRTAVPLVAEMELYFSCLIRKRVIFREGEEPSAAHRVTDRLSVRFRPVMTRGCSLDPAEAAPPITDFPLAQPRRLGPRWLRIDHRGGQWQGDFGLSAQPAAARWAPGDPTS